MEIMAMYKNMARIRGSLQGKHEGDLITGPSNSTYL